MERIKRSSRPGSSTNPPGFLQTGEEMGELIGSVDWSQTSVGAPGTWPQSLRTSISICLQSPFPVILFWTDDFVPFYNEAFSTLLGNLHPGLLGGNIRMLQEMWPDLQANLEQVLCTGCSLISKYPRPVINENTPITYLNFTQTPVSGELGNAGVFCIVSAEPEIDTTGDFEERLQHTLDAASLGTYELISVTGEIIFSPRVAQIFGVDVSKKIDHRDLTKSIHPEDRPIRDAAQAKAKESGILFYEVRIVWPDNSIHWVRVSGKMIFDSEGNAKRTYGTVADITADKQAGALLEESERELRTIADAIPHMVWVIDPDGTVSYINKQWADWTGLTLNEINSGRWEEVFHPDDIAKVTDSWKLAMENGEMYSGEYRIKSRRGNYLWFMGKTIPIRNHEGKIVKWIGTITNVDEQKKIQDALQESEEQFRQLADSMPQIVWTARPDGYLDYYNKKWYDFTGFKKHSNPDTSREKILHPDDVLACNERWKNSVKTGKPYYIEYRFKNRKKPGSYCWYLGRALPILNSKGEIVKWYGTCTDINDQKQIENLLKRSEERFRQMADSVPQQVWTATANGGLDYVNQKTINYFGKTFDELVGAGKFDGIHPDDVPVVVENWKRSLEAFEPFQVEYRLRDKNNVYRWHLARATPYANKSNEVKWFGTNTDIEEHKYTEQKKDEFISIASHELKTPITSLKGISFILKEVLESTKIAQVPRLLATMEGQLNKLSKLVSDLLDVNKIEGHQLQLNRQEFDFRELIAETVEGIQHVSVSHEIIIEPGEPVTYEGDKVRLEQVITNLLTNAIKYSPDGRQVIVRHEVTNENIIVSVQDFGIGIARENVTKLFDRFYRVHNSLRFGGLGLGLYISANIIKAHQGNFWIESQMDKGSTFYFLLPRKGVNGSHHVETDNQSFYKDDSVRIKFNKERQWIEASWTGFQNSESVRRGALAMLELLRKNGCTKVLNDNSGVLGNWSEAAEWAGKIWLPQMQNSGLEYLAWVYSASTFSQLAAEKSIDIMAGSITTQLFNGRNEAESWLIHQG